MVQFPGGTSSLVGSLVRDSGKPGANKKQIRTAAEALLPIVEKPIDQAWLHIVIARTLPKKQQDEARSNLNTAYTMAKQHNLNSAMVCAGLGLHEWYIKADQRDEARAIMNELFDLARKETADALANLGASVTDGIGTLLVRTGSRLAAWGNRVAAHPLPTDDTTNRS